MRYLATDFLQATAPNSVKIFTTGHSLGGAMCSNFAYLWMGIKKTAPYNSKPYDVLADNIICVSLGAPRCMSSSVAKKFCNFVAQNKILYLRIITNGDPVPALPPKNPLYPNAGFEHPCSTDDKMRAIVSEACAPQLTMRPKPNVNYSGNLDCLNYKARIYAPNPLSHTIYLDIIYTNAVDIVNFIKGIGISKEVLRTKNKSTVCRLEMGFNNTYKAIFFDVNSARLKPSELDSIMETSLSTADPNASNLLAQTGGAFFSLFGSQSPVPQAKYVEQADVPQATSVQAPLPGTNSPLVKQKSLFQTPTLPKIGGPVAEDVRMTSQAFNTLIQEMVPLTGDLCPQSGQMANPFNNQSMPDLSCPALKFGGGRLKRKKSKTKKIKKTKKTKRVKRNYKTKKY
jgi:hypothetical protein